MRILRLVLSVVFINIMVVAWASVSGPVVPRIINGTAANPGEHDYFVALMTVYNWDEGISYEPVSASRYNWNSFCGGSYVGNQTIITAAHCVQDLPSTGNLYVLVGNYSDSGMQYEYCADDKANYSCTGGDTYAENLIAGFHPTGWTYFDQSLSNELIKVPVSSVIVHPFFNSRSLAHDIALIKLPNPINNSPVLLPEVDLFPTLAATGDAANVQVVGHGDTISDLDKNTFIASAQLLEADVTARTDAQCRQFFGSSYIAGTMICAGDANLDSCQGDSGGPLLDIQTTTLLGVVSWGPSQCGAPNESYAVYTNVYNYMAWIESGGLLGYALNMIDQTPEGETVRMGNTGAGSFGSIIWLLSALMLMSRRRR